MSTLFWTLFAYLVRAGLALRYRIEVRGLEKLQSHLFDRKRGTLFMPNHPAHMDPVILFLWLWPKYRMRPLEIEHIYKLPFLKPFNKLIRAIMIPNFENAVNEYKVKLGERSIQEIAQGLKKGENFIVYPAGRLKGDGKELIGGASGVHEILNECPNTNVVLIRTTGLWGSSFSKALWGRSPEIMPNIWHGIKVLFKNLIFFAPRRRVLVEIEFDPAMMPKQGASRIEFNRFLENWYNRYPDEQGNLREKEPLTLVSYSRWREELPEIWRVSKKTRQVNNGSHAVSEEVRKKITNQLRKILEKPDLDIQPEMSLAYDLGMDSLNIAEFITYLTKNFEIGELHPEDLESVGTVLELAAGGAEMRLPKGPASTFTWPPEKNRLSAAPPLGRIIPEAFLHSCQRMGKTAACGDDLIGVMSYQKLKKAVLVLASYFQTWKEDRVAVMLPASTAAYIVILALQFARKTPVMLNWTLGPRYLEEMMKISGASKIVTSEKFLDRLANVQFGSCIDRLISLESIRRSLTLKMKLRGVYLSKCPIKKVLKSMDLNQVDENSSCVILFTSGTEASPKGVPLSHKNIISNLRSAIQCIELNSQDVLYGILPPFHSFGFSVAGLFPLLSGIKVAFYPDPTDSFALAEGLSRWKISIFCAAPSFIKGLFHAAKQEQLKSVRLFVSGAEKAPEPLFEKAKTISQNCKLVEGYGITECSPILSINRPNMPPKGVGRLLPEIELVTIHPETLQLLPKGSDGEICVRGPNVFRGYLGNPRSPFIELEGKQWYRTGDLGHLDIDGSLILSGRLKRFTKIGGEMISLGAVEEVIVKHLVAEKRISPNINSIAVCADEREEGKPRLVLFTTIAIEKEEANQILSQAGFSNLVKISIVKNIDEIPLMGAGKTDYRNLQGLC
jgi:long-chain-fatty-acid--[acyl-carrier-protein] ligase